VAFGPGGVYVSLATGNGHFAAPTFELANFGVSTGGWTDQNHYPRLLGDLRGDGKADIVGFGAGGVYVSCHPESRIRVALAVSTSGRNMLKKHSD
jgi:hypothetical protein